MKTGRPRTATAIQEAKGAFDKNPQRRRTGEPVADGEAARPPFVKGAAAKIWQHYAPLVAKMGLLKAVDSHNFGVWCCLAAEFAKDPERMNANRITQMRQMGEKFGLDPRSRAALGSGDGDEDKDPADQYFDSINTGSSKPLCN